MTLPTQDELFGSEIPSLGVDTSFSGARRIAIDAHSWVELVPGWMSGSRILFERLTTAVPWRQHDRRLFQISVQASR